MKSRIVITLTVLLAIVTSSCKKERVKPTSDITVEERNVSSFSNIEVSDAIEVIINFSNVEEQNVVVEANSNIHQYLKVKVVDNTLVLEVEDDVHFKSSADIRVYITMPFVNNIDLSGASNVEFLNRLSTNHLKITISGASKLKGSVTLASLDLELSGASLVDLDGYCGTLKAELSGASNLKDDDLSVDLLDIELSGASNADLTVNEIIVLIASGASNLNYKGDASINEIELSGASNINKK